VLAGCAAAKSPAGARFFDPCATVRIDAPGASDAQLAAIDRAIAAWHGVGVVALQRTLGPADVTIELVSGSPIFNGEYEPADAVALVNTDLDADQTAITIAHELGHALGLVHVPAQQRASVMNPGNLVTWPNADDARAIVSRWGPCSRPPLATASSS